MARSALYTILGYINGKAVRRGQAVGRNEASILAEEMQGKESSVAVGIYNRKTGQLVGVKKPKVCRSGKRF